MAIKSLTLALIQDAQEENGAARAYALDLAASTKAHLSVAIGVPPLILPTSYPAPQMVTFVEDENCAQRKAAEATAESIRKAGLVAGTPVSVAIYADAYDPLGPRLVRAARLTDLSIVAAPAESSAIAADLVEDLLMSSGGPILIVPRAWTRGAAMKTAVVAWDGSAAAARAVRDAMPLMAAAEAVEVVSVTGEKDVSRELPAADIAAQIARHCSNVRATTLPMMKEGIGQTLRHHAELIRADLLVMGGYGHARFRELVLGGVTRDRLRNLDLPTLMSH
jgi:nucleotide-binding universal stress UspA family protein